MNDYKASTNIFGYCNMHEDVMVVAKMAHLLNVVFTLT